MKILYTLIFSWLMVAATAQPVLLNSEMLPFNSQMNFQNTTSYSLIDTSIQGSNKIWDFHLIQSSGAGIQMTVKDPATTQYGSSFPGANYCYRETPDTFYSYFSRTSTKMERLGSSYYTDLTTYSDPQIEYVFPLQLGSVNNDTWESDGNSFPGYYNINCIGYGTLKLPSVNYSNALMVRVDFSNGFFDFPVYFWYSGDNGAVLLQYIPNNGFGGTTAMYLSSLTIGIEENELPYTIAYNNPVNDKLSILLSSKKTAEMEYSVTDILGKITAHESFRLNGQMQDLTIDFSSLPQGIYFVRFNQQNETAGKTIKIIKR
jgi:hypothetical protein